MRQFLYCSVTISSKDENFTAVVDFIAKLSADDNNLLLAETKKKKFDRKSWQRTWNGIGQREGPKIDYRPTKSGAMTTFLFRDQQIMMWRRPK